jgi:pimeloyl-ACP methyl ester carboxylesterase
MTSARFVWLHGFASGPSSSKGRFVRGRLASRGAWLSLPDLNQPDFRALTVGRMLEQVDALWAETRAPLVLFGSSLGGFTAAQWAALHPERCAALLLLAPAFALVPRWEERMGAAELQRWRAQGSFAFDHYAYRRKAELAFRFLEEARGYPDFPLPPAPTLVVQGLRDDLVLPQLATDFCSRRAAAGLQTSLHELDQGHELTADLPGLWTLLERFLEQQRLL